MKKFLGLGALMLAVFLVMAAAGTAADSPLLVDTEETLPPDVQPVVFLEGSDYDIGYQYGYFGANYVESFSNHVWTEMYQAGHTKEEVHEILNGFHYHMEETFPEVVESFKGMLDGARDAGYDLTYYDVILSSHQWDVMASYDAEYPPADPDEALDGKGCSTFTAWGSSTDDGRIVAGNSADGEFGPQVTMVIFPETGYDMVSTAEFGVWAWNFTVNSQGLYQAINWTPAERPEDMDYGLASTLVIYRNGRFAATTEEAGDMLGETPLTIGENYLFLDREHDAKVFETSAAVFASRQPGDMGEEDMLISSNNRFIEEAQAAGAGYGVDRHDQLFDLGTLAAGSIDEGYVELMFGLPPVARPGNRAVHLATITDDGISVRIATGAASTAGAWSSGPIRPTYSFYQLDLEESPEAVTQSVKGAAQERMALANELYHTTDGIDRTLLEEAREEYYRGIMYEDRAYVSEENNQRLLNLSRAATAYTKSQAFSNQVINSVEYTDNPWLYLYQNR